MTDGATPNAGPLAGRVIMVTRTAAQSRALAGPLEVLGAAVVACPVIEIVDPPDWGPTDAAIADLASYGWIVLTSANAVERFVERMDRAGRDHSILRAASIAVVGSGTASKLASYGIEPTLVPEDFRGEGLIEAFDELGVGEGVRVLVPRALDAREILPDTLREMGCVVDVVPVYQTVAARCDPEIVQRFREGEIDVVTFTSPSTFVHWAAAVEHAGLDPHEVASRVLTASIGPVTTAAMKARGYEADIEAQESTVPGLVAAIARRFEA